MYIEFPLANCCSKSQRISSLSIRSSEPLTAPAPVRFRGMNWVQRKIFLYNVTFGLYMLDWWERCLFNILVIVLMWFIFYNSSRYVTVFLKGDASEGWNCVCYTVVSLVKTLPAFILRMQ
uniref:Uncharacterized protein n=1 Tax=Gossypium raimondii TaxID=29730 RepID=A0A0D2Q5G2_GOSRA|nr:hypothetical protein B456_002G129000 [Gossypium raimondii]